MKRSLHVLAVSFLFLCTRGCTSSVPVYRVPDIDEQKESIRRTLDMVDGLDDQASQEAVLRVQRLMQGELTSCRRRLDEMHRALTMCSIHLEDAKIRESHSALHR
ncbi:MAG: hypothetical protein F9K24_22480 [Leptonema illini]|uniref:Uncharacterized protein n=1 Tax=Leptonema illini TaxID=183 RepID=A0A833LU73_9LEPT|nr:MAG: hypothetical protein F9K24_22480 [Leptonema illini]